MPTWPPGFAICAAEGAVPALVGLPFALLPGLTQVSSATAYGLWRGAAVAVSAVGLAILVAAAVVGWLNLPPGKLL